MGSFIWAMVRNELNVFQNFKTYFVNILIKFFYNFIYDILVIYTLFYHQMI